jgi:predicted transcriptional regulator
MTVRELLKEIPMDVVCGKENLDREILRGFSSDMMSNVIAKGIEGEVWITFQTHLNVVAIALMKKMAAVVLVQDRKLIPRALEKAEAEGLPILSTSLSAFELGGRMFKLGISGD